MSSVKIGLIGGTGLGEALLREHDGRRHEVNTPFGKPSDSIIETEISGIQVFILNRHGPGHLLNPSRIPARANIFALKTLGVTHIISSGAVGSLRDEFKPRDLVIPDQIIDKTIARPGTFFDDVAVHVEMSEPLLPDPEAARARGRQGSVGRLGADTRPRLLCLHGGPGVLIAR